MPEKNTMENRNTQRTIFRKRCFLGISNPDYVGFTEDISLDGLHIVSETSFSPGTKVVVGFVSERVDIKIKVKGVIKWLIEANLDNKTKALNHMGVSINWHDDNYLQFISDLIESKRLEKEFGEDNRQHFRYDEKVTVIFENESEILEQLTENISKGGIFVCTDRPLNKDTMVSLRIVIPQLLEDVKILGEVTFSLSLAQAKVKRRPPGMGIKFVKFEHGDKAKFIRFLNKLAAKYNRA